jgi:catechol-2,3-dioxygenase
MADEKKKFILVVGISGTVTVVVEAKDEDEARAMEDNFQYHLGCLEDARTDCVEVLEAAPQDELDMFVDADDPFNDGMLLLDRAEP